MTTVHDCKQWATKARPLPFVANTTTSEQKNSEQALSDGVGVVKITASFFFGEKCLEETEITDHLGEL